MRNNLNEEILEACRYEEETLYLVIGTIISSNHDENDEERFGKIIDAILWLFRNKKITIKKKSVLNGKDVLMDIKKLEEKELFEYVEKNRPFQDDEEKFATDEYFIIANEE